MFKPWDSVDLGDCVCRTLAMSQEPGLYRSASPPFWMTRNKPQRRAWVRCYEAGAKVPLLYPHPAPCQIRTPAVHEWTTNAPRMHECTNGKYLNLACTSWSGVRHGDRFSIAKTHLRDTEGAES